VAKRFNRRLYSLFKKSTRF